MIDNEFMYKFAKRLALDGPGRVVVRDGDSFVDSYIVHPPLIGQTKFVLRSKSCDILIYFSNVPYT